MRSYLFSAFIVYGLSFLSVLNWISIHRDMMLASVAIASLPMILFTMRTGKSLASWRRGILAVAIIVLIMPQFLLVHEPAMARSGAVASIERTSVFLLESRNGRELASLKNVTDFLLTRPKGTLSS